MLILAAVTGFGATLALVPLAWWLSWKVGAIDEPGGRKQHERPIPALGGIAVVLGTAVATAGVLTLEAGREWISGPGVGGELRVLGAAVLFLSFLGALDDLRGLGARFKLAVQAGVAIAAAWWVVDATTIDFGWFQLSGLGGGIALGLVAFWLVAITNAFNMVDGHDGLASGVGAIAAGAFALAAGMLGNPAVAAICMALSGAFAAFLLFNFPPAKIFLGDSGSLPLGFLLAVAGVKALTSGDAWIVVPTVLILGIPVLDVTISVARRGLQAMGLVRQARLRERFVLQVRGRVGLFDPDRGHLHHRLRDAGFGAREAMGLVYGAGASAALLGILSLGVPGWAPAVLLLSGSTVVLLAVTRLYPELQVLRRGLLLPFFGMPLVRSRVVHAAYDALVVVGGLLLVGSLRELGGGDRIPLSSPHLLLGTSVLAALHVGGIYQAQFRHAGLWLVLRTGAWATMGMAVGIALTVAVAGLRLPPESWGLFVYVALTGIVGARVSFRIVDAMYQRKANSGQRTLIYGAGRRGHLVLKELLSNRDLAMNPVAFLDDDPALLGREVEGYPVLSPDEELQLLLTSDRISTVVVSTGKIRAHRIAAVADQCAKAGARLLLFRWGVSEEHPSSFTEPRAEGVATEVSRPTAPTI